MKTNALAPIEMKILLWRGSPQKIVMDSGNSFLYFFKVSADNLAFITKK
nr:hypothetical protein [uncultured Flavobacterium sp.]